MIDRPFMAKRQSQKWTVADRLKSAGYTKDSLDLKIDYANSQDEERVLTLRLSREEAKELMGEISAFLNDNDWEH